MYNLHSRDTWLKEAKTVKVEEEPYKIVEARPKWDRVSVCVCVCVCVEEGWNGREGWRKGREEKGRVEEGKGRERWKKGRVEEGKAILGVRRGKVKARKNRGLREG